MATDRKLIDYLPQFMQEYRELQQIMNAEQPDFDDLWAEYENIFADQFIMDATENGVKRWETMLGITPKDTNSLDERKFRILTKLNQELPYTLIRLKEALTTLCGADGFAIDLQPAIYHIEVKLALSNQNNYQAVVDLLTKMIPANLTQRVKIMYVSHEIISQCAHQDLSAYTHEQLREVFANG